MSKHVVAALAFVSLAAGCAGPDRYRDVDLRADLPPDAIRRYEQEWQQLTPAERTSHAARLEHTNWWLPGLIAYYRRGAVERMQGPDGPVYHVSYGRGFGPLSLLYARTDHATYDADGQRLSGGGMSACLLGHLAMTHHADARLRDGRHERMDSYHLFHHVLNIHAMAGHSYVSLFTLPNPLGAELPSGGGAAHHHGGREGNR